MNHLTCLKVGSKETGNLFKQGYELEGDFKIGQLSGSLKFQPTHNKTQAVHYRKKSCKPGSYKIATENFHDSTNILCFYKA